MQASVLIFPYDYAFEYCMSTINIGMMSLTKKRRMNEVDMQQQTVSCTQNLSEMLSCSPVWFLDVYISTGWSCCTVSLHIWGWGSVSLVICCPYSSLCDLFFFQFHCYRLFTCICHFIRRWKAAYTLQLYYSLHRHMYLKKISWE